MIFPIYDTATNGDKKDLQEIKPTLTFHQTWSQLDKGSQMKIRSI